MATIDKLCEDKTLSLIKVHLPRGKFDDRRFYAFPQFQEWLFNDVKAAEPIIKGNIAPRHQALDLLVRYNSGGELNIGRTFKRMRPVDQDVFEFCTPDLRIFGWFYKKDCFIAVFGNFMDNTHGHDLYQGYRDEVKRIRDELDLDPPKWIEGADEYDVISF